MLVFLDTEFTSIEAPELLSIGLVTDAGDELYVELAGNFPLVNASTFVLDTVVPQFGLMPQSVTTTLAELGQLVGVWLLELAASGTAPLDVAYDYHTDFDLLELALQAAGLWDQVQKFLEPTHVAYLIGDDFVESAMEASWMNSFATNGIRRHHSLADARALRAGFVAMHGGGETPAAAGG
jgi:hypothetical protein